MDQVGGGPLEGWASPGSVPRFPARFPALPGAALPGLGVLVAAARWWLAGGPSFGAERGAAARAGHSATSATVARTNSP
mgnify:CR=1 FL=1